MPTICKFRIATESKALTARGTSCAFSSTFRAVTRISSIKGSSSASAVTPGTGAQQSSKHAALVLRLTYLLNLVSSLDSRCAMSPTRRLPACLLLTGSLFQTRWPRTPASRWMQERVSDQRLVLIPPLQYLGHQPATTSRAGPADRRKSSKWGQTEELWNNYGRTLTRIDWIFDPQFLVANETFMKVTINRKATIATTPVTSVGDGHALRFRGARRQRWR